MYIRIFMFLILVVSACSETPGLPDTDFAENIKKNGFRYERVYEYSYNAKTGVKSKGVLWLERDYTENGTPGTEKSYSNAGIKLGSIDEYEYDSEGRLSSIIHKNGRGKILKRSEFIYSGKFLREKNILSSHGKKITSTVYKNEDSKNLLKEYHFNKAGKPTGFSFILGNPDFARLSPEHGLVSRESSEIYNKSGKLVSYSKSCLIDPHSIEELFYNGKNLIVRRSVIVFNDKRKITRESNYYTAAYMERGKRGKREAVEYMYGGNGLPERETHYNNEGKPVREYIIRRYLPGEKPDGEIEKLN